jgi:hypothetical protein
LGPCHWPMPVCVRACVRACVCVCASPNIITGLYIAFFVFNVNVCFVFSGLAAIQLATPPPWGWWWCVEGPRTVDPNAKDVLIQVGRMLNSKANITQV